MWDGNRLIGIAVNDVYIDGEFVAAFEVYPEFELAETKDIEIEKTVVDIAESDIDVIKTENLYEFDGVRGYSLGQGQ